jgi:hypothetical protein
VQGGDVEALQRSMIARAGEMRTAAPRRGNPEGSRRRARRLEAGEVAWLAVVPCAAIVVLAIALLGPVLGPELFARRMLDRFWPEVLVAPEPTEHARFAIALLGGPFVAAVILTSTRRAVRLRPAWARVLIATARGCVVTFVAIALLAQHNVLFRSYIPPSSPDSLFTLSTLAAAAVLAGVLAILLTREAVLVRAMRIARETRIRRVACMAVAVVLTLTWLSAAFNTERSIGLAEVNHLIPWDMSETFAVLDGRTPLVDFHSQYAHLLPYLAAAVLRIFGTSVAVWTGTMIVMSAGALLAVYAVLRRVVRSSVLAVALFIPFLVGSGSLARGVMSPFEVFSVWPMRYGGPLVLAWLTARHLDGAAPRRRWLLFAAAGLVAINNVEFGLPALGGTLMALAYAGWPWSRAFGLRLLRDLGVGSLASVLLVSVLSVLHGGRLPDFSLLFEFPRIYGVEGWVLEPMPTFGFHLGVYATFVAAIVVATVRIARADDGAVLTGTLIWSGIFGLGAASYYVGRSNTDDLLALFGAWCLALVLLAVVVAGRLAGTARRPTLPDLTVLFACGLVACALFETPRPWAELARIRHETAAIYKQAAAVRFVRRTTTPGQKVAILIGLGHRIAYDAGVVNVSPYSGAESIPTRNQLRAVFAAMRSASVTTLYVDDNATYLGVQDALREAGYAFVTNVRSYVMYRRTPSRHP